MESTLPDLELQQELQRFTSQLMERVTEASDGLLVSRLTRVRNEALRRNLLYVSSAVDIATGPDAAVNVLDMFVFVRLSRSVLEQHWVPHVYGDDGRELALAFTRCETELSALVERALGSDVLRRLNALVDAWRNDNPGQIRVEGVRLTDFSAAVGSGAAERSAQARGLLSSVKSAARSANAALLLTERAFFLVHRLPFLWRLQARLGAREIVADTLETLTEGPESVTGKLAVRARAVGRGSAVLAAALGALLMVVRRVRR